MNYFFFFLVVSAVPECVGASRGWATALKAANTYYTSDAKILIIGDSIAKGVGCSSDGRTDTCGWVAQLSQLMKSRGYKVLDSFGLPTAPGIVDARWAMAGGFHQQFTGFGGKTGWQGPTGATQLQVTATGGVATVVDTVGSSQAVQKLTVAAGDYWSKGNKVDLSCGAGTLTYDPGVQEHFDRFDVYYLQDQGYGTCFITAIEPWSSVETTVRIADAGVAAATSADWLVPWSVASIQAYQPDLTLICLGPNDAAAGLPIVQYRQNIEQLIKIADQTGDVLLMSFLPSWSAQVSAEVSYYDELTSISADQQVPLIDIWSDFEGTFQHFLMSDGMHPKKEGHAALASFADEFLHANGFY